MGNGRDPVTTVSIALKLRQRNDGASYAFERISTVAHNMTNTTRSLCAHWRQRKESGLRQRALPWALIQHAAHPTASPLAAALASTALAACRKRLRQGGYYDNLVAQQPNLMRRVSKAMTAFYDATVELGVSRQGDGVHRIRLWPRPSSNGDGSDHGWGSHHFHGGRVPSRPGVLWQGATGEHHPTPPTPTTSGTWARAACCQHVSDQYAATLAKWFGVATPNWRACCPT